MCVFRASLLAVLLAAPSMAAERPLLGASVYGGMAGFKDEQLVLLSAEGFKLVSFVPTYPYIDLNRVDFSGGPSWKNVEDAITLALYSGFTVVLKPHLDPAAYIGGYTPPESVVHSWRMDCGWRGYFDVDPDSADYRALVLHMLESLKGALERQKSPAPPIRFELGAELMNSTVYSPGRWAELLDYAKKERKRLGLEGRVLLSHNFEHHIEMPTDAVSRMTPEGRKDLARYIKGLDALALSQYMDLTAAVPQAERDKRLPDAAEVASAFQIHEADFREKVLQGMLGLKAAEIPPIHIGEFGVGTGGLKSPNLWAGELTPDKEKALDEQIALGHAGLARYLESGKGPPTASLWTVGRHFDVFGWGNPAYLIPAAAEADRAYLKAR
ncbi:MAG: hypothetical protein HY077_16095 [Elusimicrobia bacterium]|nr:hypothetical protein [Elusimicrobiota bacterium]